MTDRIPRACTFALFALLALSSSHSDAATLRVHYDTGWGNGISIRGDAASLSWYGGQGATWTQGNVWVYNTPVSDGGFAFKPLLNDANWSVGANYTVPSGNSVVDVYPFFGAQGGTLVQLGNFYSAILGNQRPLTIYLPPSYQENPLKHYPVMYLHDGQNLFDPNMSFGGVEWQVDETVDSMVRQGQMREVIVVGLGNTAARISEYTPTEDSYYGGGNGDAYLDFIQYEVMPYVDGSYRTLTGPESTLIGGSSLGGLISFYAAWTRSDVFGSAIAMSSSFWWDDEALTDDVFSYGGPLIDARFYIDSGTDGATQTFTMRSALESQGYSHGVNLHHWHDPQGTHNEASWAARFHIPVDRLLAP